MELKVGNIVYLVKCSRGHWYKERCVITEVRLAWFILDDDWTHLYPECMLYAKIKAQEICEERNETCHAKT